LIESGIYRVGYGSLGSGPALDRAAVDWARLAGIFMIARTFQERNA
jgi:hypothetical protein